MVTPKELPKSEDNFSKAYEKMFHTKIAKIVVETKTDKEGHCVLSARKAIKGAKVNPRRTTRAKRAARHSHREQICLVREGISYKNFKLLSVSIDIPNKKWAVILGISEKTMQNIHKEKRNLEQNKAEKLMSFLTLVRYGVEIFGNVNSFKQWLEYKAPALKNKAPSEYLDTTQGINMLKEQLSKIETGNLA